VVHEAVPGGAGPTVRARISASFQPRQEVILRDREIKIAPRGREKEIDHFNDTVVECSDGEYGTQNIGISDYFITITANYLHLLIFNYFYFCVLFAFINIQLNYKYFS